MILLDECVHRSIAQRLSAVGIAFITMSDLAPSTTDTDVLSLACARRLILLTRDKDFGDLVFRDRLPAYAVVLYRLPEVPPSDIPDRVVSFILANLDQLPGTFSLIDEHGSRTRPLPPTAI